MNCIEFLHPTCASSPCHVTPGIRCHFYWSHCLPTITRASWSPPSPYWGTATVVGSAPAQNGAINVENPRKSTMSMDVPCLCSAKRVHIYNHHPGIPSQKWASTPRSTSGTCPGGAWGLHGFQSLTHIHRKFMKIQTI